MAVAAPQAGAEALVGMLIKQERETIQPVASGEGGGAQPASFNAPMAAPVAAPVPGKNWPTRAVRPAAPGANEPTPAPPRDGPLSPVKQEPTRSTARFALAAEARAHAGPATGQTGVIHAQALRAASCARAAPNRITDQQGSEKTHRGRSDRCS